MNISNDTDNTRFLSCLIGKASDAWLPFTFHCRFLFKSGLGQRSSETSLEQFELGSTQWRLSFT